MERLEVNEFENKLEILKSLVKIREIPNEDLEQQYITYDSIIRRLRSLKDLINNQRVLAIGDADLTATSIAIFGSPKEIIIADIDRRMADLLFEANIKFNLSVQFVYHDMRIRIMEILMNQFTLIIMDLPR
ncbi:MAG: N(4)-bis(aminopropyl)spermidine synthase [Candidatus Heimdallarchaeota archaeon LC_2]|nr:MAG: N(4)-bis(aminopropyl)spermidine synthase [Candidatus Heimdallarchaeota archaeon LC_2]